MNSLYKQLAVGLALWLCASVAAAETPTCIDTTFSTTGRQQLTVPGGAEIYGSVRFSYRTTGSPTGVSISIEAGNVAAATQTPFEQIAAVTNTAGASMGTAAAGWRFWFANVATLAGGASPTIILTSCFHPSAFSIARFGTVPTFPNQSANTLFAGPGSGAAATPAFRARVLADLPAAALSGGGTANTLPKWTAATTLANSQLSDDGTNITASGNNVRFGIGSAAPSARLSVVHVGAYIRPVEVIFSGTALSRPAGIIIENLDVAAQDVGSIIVHHGIGSVQQGYYGFTGTGAATTNAR